MVERGRESLAFARLRKAMAEPLERERLAAAQALEALYLDDLKRGLNPGGMPSAPRST